MKLITETSGLKAEILGLCILFFATVWQAVVSDWFDGFPAESQYYSQRTANQAILNSIHQTALALSTDNGATRNQLLLGAQRITADAQVEIDQIKHRADKLENRLGGIEKKLRVVLFLLSALLIILGKCLDYKYKVASSTRLTD